MVDDAESAARAGEALPVAEEPLAAPAAPAAPACPWCSEPLPSIDAASCPSCGARLVGDEGVDIPGVTTVDPGLRAAAAAPRKVKRTFGSLLVGDDNDVPPPSEAEMPALAPPDLEVRREMLRLELEARLRGLRAEVQAIESEERADAKHPAGAEGRPHPEDPAGAESRPDAMDRADAEDRAGAGSRPDAAPAPPGPEGAVDGADAGAPAPSPEEPGGAAAG
jgi:hypothetical protein